MGKFKMPSIKEIEQDENIVTEPKLKVGAGLLSDTSKQMVMMKTANIPRERIVKNEENKYSIGNIPALAESIKQYGLIQPLHVMPENEKGMYKLLGGERRLTAIDMLIADEKVMEWNEDTLIPCVIKGAEEVKLDLSPENKERYAIITTNKEGRVYTDGDRYMEIQEWKKIIAELRENGVEYIEQYDEDGTERPLVIKGEKTRDILSQATGISRGQVNKFETVENKGSAQLKNALLDGKITIGVAEKAAKEMTEEEQNNLVKKAEKKSLTVADVTKEKNSGTEKIITSAGFRKDIKNITVTLKDKEILLDEMQYEKYNFYIRQIENLLGGHK